MPKILIVDDDDKIVARAIDFFTLERWEIQGASNGSEALRTLDSSFDGVILDLRMSVMDGERTLAEIRKRFDLESVCVVVLTAHGEVSSAVSTIRQGAYQYLEKPFKLPDLLRILVAGIASQRANALRRELLGSFNTDALLDRIRSIIIETINPKGVHVIFVSSDGFVRGISGAGHDVNQDLTRRCQEKAPAFLRHILRSKEHVFEIDHNQIGNWDPFLKDSKSMLAVPVPGPRQTIAGVIDIESPVERAFDRNWVEVMRQLADLAGISMEIAQKAERNAELEAEQEHWRRIPLVANELGHQISTPVHVIMLQLQTLQAKEFSSKEFSELPDTLKKEIGRRISTIAKNAEETYKVCSYLRDVSREIHMAKESTDVVEILETCIEEYLSEFQDNRIKIEFDDKARNSLMINADPGLIKYSLQCILSNAIDAIKERRDHAAAKESRLPPSRAADDIIALKLDQPEGGEEVRITIQDTGIGIPEENQEEIFEPLYTTKGRDRLNPRRDDSGSSERNWEGVTRDGGTRFSGMGLFSVKRIITQHKGSVTVASRYGEGATFTVLLPLGGSDG